MTSKCIFIVIYERHTHNLNVVSPFFVHAPVDTPLSENEILACLQIGFLVSQCRFQESYSNTFVLFQSHIILFISRWCQSCKISSLCPFYKIKWRRSWVPIIVGTDKTHLCRAVAARPLFFHKIHSMPIFTSRMKVFLLWRVLFLSWMRLASVCGGSRRCCRDWQGWRWTVSLWGGRRNISHDRRGLQIAVGVVVVSTLPPCPSVEAEPPTHFLPQYLPKWLVEKAVQYGIYDGCQHSGQEGQGVCKRCHHRPLGEPVAGELVDQAEDDEGRPADKEDDRYGG